MWTCMAGYSKKPKTKNGSVAWKPAYNRPAPRRQTAGKSKPGKSFDWYTSGGKAEGLKELTKELTKDVKASNGAASPPGSAPASPSKTSTPTAKTPTDAKDATDTKTTSTKTTEATTTTSPSKTTAAVGTEVEPKAEKAGAPAEVPGQVRMLVCGIDYKTGQKQSLTSTTDAGNMVSLGKACGVSDITTLLERACTKDAMTAAITKVLSRCGPDDYFVFYFAGHGTSKADLDGDEADGTDEAFVCYDEQLLIDDDFSALLLNQLHQDTRVLILTDACCSGTIADLDRPEWSSKQAIAISGCTDSQKSGDTGKGGIFTHCMLLAADKLGDAGEENQSVGMFYNAVVKSCETCFQTEQDIVIHTAPGFQENKMAWPLVPPKDYVAPFTEVAKAGSDPIKAVISRSFSPQASSILNCTCDRERESLKKLGITPSQMARANPEAHLATETEGFIKSVKGEEKTCSVM